MDPNAFRSSSTGRLVRTPTDYWAFVPAPLPPKITWSPGLIEDLSRADRALGELSGLGRSLLNPHLLILPFLRREAVLSSRIEGTEASLSDLYIYEAVQPSSTEEQDSDVREVHNYVEAMEYGLERLDTLPLSLRLIRELHARLMAGVRGEHQTPGEFRRSQNWIGPPGCTLNEATYVPPPVVEMHEALDALEKFLHAPSSLPPLVRLGLIHYQFEAIHPFLDGNGRIGRLLMTLLLCEWDILPLPLLYLSAYFDERRQTYYELLLEVSREGRWVAWLAFFLRGVASQSRDAVIRTQRLLNLREKYREQFQTRQAASRLLQLVDLLFERPVLTTRQAEQSLGVNFASAQRYIDRLTGAGILREITGQARNRIYIAESILNVINEAIQL